MAVELANAYVSIIPSARGMTANLTRELAGPTNAAAATAGTKAGKTFGGKFSGALGGIARSGAALGIAGLALGVGKVLTSSVAAATESMKVTKDTEAVIKSMGGVANISAGQVANLSLAIAKKTGVDDEAIQVGQNLLLTFGNIRNEVGAGNDMFNRASAVIVDFAARFKTDIPGAARLVGKALNDPIRGLTSLTRVGVQFTDSQKAQIKAMVESGNLMGAQQIIMAELRRQTEGSAVAQATAADKMRVAWGNLQEELGAKLLPVVEAFSTWMTEKGIPFMSMLMERFDALSPSVKRFVLIAAGVLAVVGPLVILLGGLPVALLAVAGAVIYAYNHFETFRDTVNAVITWITGTAVPAIQDFGQSFADTFNGISESVSHTMNVITDVIRVAVTVISFLWNTFGQTILGYVSAVWQTIYGVIAGFLQVIQGIIQTVLAVINGDWGKAWEGIKLIFQGFVTSVQGILGGFLTFIQAAIGNALTIIQNLWGDAWDAVKATITDAAAAIVATITSWRDTIISIFSNAITWLTQGGSDVLTGLWNGISSVWTGTVKPWFDSFPTLFGNFVSNAVDWLNEGGKNIMRGLKNGIFEIWGDVKKWFKDLPGNILDILGISSPPQWAIDAGKWIMKGVGKGIGWGAGSVWDFMGKFAGKFVGPLKSAWDDVSGFFASLAGGIAGLFSGSGSGTVNGLVGFAARAMTLFRSMFPGMDIGGWRARGSVPGSDHPKGKALDLMTGNSTIASQIIRTFLGMPGAKYWIWNRQIATAASGWRPRDYRGPNPHTDHVHLSFFRQGAWRTGNELAQLHAGEMVLPARLAGAVRSALAGGGAGGSGTYVAPGAVVIGMPPGATLAEAERLGGAAGRSFLEVLARRRVVTDARIA